MEEDIRVLIADDEEAVQDFLCSVLREQNFKEVHVSRTGAEAYAKLIELHPDLLITDLVMPEMRGEELARRALEVQPDITILVTTGNGTLEGAVEMLRSGVYDFITKPFDLDCLHASLARGVNRCMTINEVSGARETIEALMVALESKDHYLRGHSKRVATMSGKLARLAGWKRQEVRMLEYAALVHDVGKIAISESILKKPGPLNDEEMRLIRKHPIFSRDILRPIRYLQRALPYVYHHHERFDGNGYPDGIRGESIPLGARIITVCDCYDAMGTERAYRKSMPRERILGILKEERGKQLDSQIVDLFLTNLESIVNPDLYEQCQPCQA